MHLIKHQHVTKQILISPFPFTKTVNNFINKNFVAKLTLDIYKRNATLSFLTHYLLQLCFYSSRDAKRSFS